MEALILKTDLHCNSCVNKVEPILISHPDIEEYIIDLEHPEKIISIKGKTWRVRISSQKFMMLATMLKSQPLRHTAFGGAGYIGGELLLIRSIGCVGVNR